MLEPGYWQYAAALLSALAIGVSKGGIKGITIAFVALMAYAFGSKASTGLILPILIGGDILAVIYYNRHCQWKYIVRLMPWMMIGVLVGVYTGKDIPEELFKKGMAFIILGSVILMYWWDQRDSKSVPKQLWFAGSIGFIAGFTTMVGNLAGAFSNIFFNLFKVPFHVYVWETITMESLWFNLQLMPAIIIGFFIGVKLVSYFQDQQYRKFILLMTAVGALLIFFR